MKDKHAKIAVSGIAYIDSALSLCRARSVLLFRVRLSLILVEYTLYY